MVRNSSATWTNINDSASTSTALPKKIVMDPFCYKEFDRLQRNLRKEHKIYRKEFTAKVNKIYLEFTQKEL